MNDRSYWIDHPTTLHGLHVILHPLNPSHFDELLAAASDKRIWEFYTGDWSVPETFYRIYHGAIIARERGNEYPFVIFHKPTQKIIGSTRLLDIVHYDKRLEI